MNIKLIACVDNNGGISKFGKIPWEIKEDTNFFLDQINRPIKQKKLVVVGRNTYEKVMNLKNCEFLIISNSFVANQDNVKVLNNLENLKNHLYSFYQEYTIFILGGKNIYDYTIKNLGNVEFIISKINYNYLCDNILNNFNMIFEVYIEHLPSKTFKLKDTKNNMDVDITFYSKSFHSISSNRIEQTYLDLLEDVLKSGDRRETRNAVTYSTFGKSLEFDLKSFPLLTTKKMFLKGIFEELMFFLRGKTDSTELSEKGVKIWEPNTTREFLDKMGFADRKVGDMGPMYGFQWRNFFGFDQLNYCINLLKTDPNSRRIIMTSYNPAQAFEGVLFPCHGICIMFYCTPIKNNVNLDNVNLDNVNLDTYYLDIMMTQRSADLFLGVPFNISSYALLNYLICDHINNSDSKYKYTPGRLIMNLGDAHIYEEHKTQVIRQILRTPLDFPEIKIKTPNDKRIESYEFENIEIINYETYVGILAKMVP
jgi:thymidylate synthase